MSKTATITIEMPTCCGECYLFRYHADTMPLGNYRFQHLFRCKLEPEDLNEDKGDVVYVNDFMRHGKPVWCPLSKTQDTEKQSKLYHPEEFPWNENPYDNTTGYHGTTHVNDYGQYD